MIDYIDQPEACSFEAQTADEKIVLILRKHFITNFGWLFLGSLLILVPPLFLSGIFGITPAAVFGLNQEAVFIVTLIWYLFLFGFVFEEFLVWYFNIYILTNKRIVDVDFYQLLYKKVSAADLSDIQDITFTMGGVAQALFNYGDVRIQTAGEMNEFDFLAVPRPAQVQKAILSASQER